MPALLGAEASPGKKGVKVHLRTSQCPRVFPRPFLGLQDKILLPTLDSVLLHFL